MKNMEFIPLGDSKTKSNKELNIKKKRKRKKTASSQYIDRQLVRDIKDYLATHADKKYLDWEEMALQLRNANKQYSRRRKEVFETAVETAYEMVMNEYGCNLTLSDSEQSDPEEIKLSENEEQSNTMNDRMRTFYSKEKEALKNFEEKLNENGDAESTDEKLKSSSNKKRKLPMKDSEPQAKKKKLNINVIKPKAKLNDVGGYEEAKKHLTMLLIDIKKPSLYERLGVKPPSGCLLHGPPGCGKTLLVHALAGEFDIPLLKISAQEVVSGVSGESEEKIRYLFEEAKSCSPCILFMDEIDSITGKRDNANKDMERRIVAQLLACMDDLKDSGSKVLVIGATNRADALDAGLRRAGRFDREIGLGSPDEIARKSILKILLKGMKLGPDLDTEFLAKWLAKSAPGYVGADLESLTMEAASAGVDRIRRDLQKKQKTENIFYESNTKDLDELIRWLKHSDNEDQNCSMGIEKEDFEEALRCVQPSAKREGFATVPDVTWDDIGALQNVKEELNITILAPIRHPEICEALGLLSPGGVLLCGPPGCGKTLIAKAVANEAHINFISVKGPELINMYVGESERAVRQCFQRARSSAPCVIFFDEIDALCPKRSDVNDSGSSARVVNQLLTEMDGLEGRKGVYIMAATNRPDILDPAVMRPGRLEKIINVKLPSAHDRPEILKAITKHGKKPSLGEDVNLDEIGEDERCEGFSGADLAALVKQASEAALREYLSKPTSQINNVQVHKKHFVNAVGKVKPSVKKHQLCYYSQVS